MKKHTSLFVLSFLSLSLLASCGGKVDPTPSEAESSSLPSIETKEDALYLGLYAESAYSPDIKGEYEVEQSDASLASFKEGKVFTYGKKGSSTITFKGKSRVIILTVHVEQDSTLPSFSLLHDEISVFKGASYELPFTLAYGSRDVTSELETVQVSQESGGEVAALSKKGNAILIEGKAKGEGVYTISCSFEGYLLSKQVKVAVKEDNSFFVYGEKMSYDEEGAKYSFSMYHYAENPLNLAQDLKASYNGEEVAYSSLTVSLSANDFASINANGDVLFTKPGSTTILISYSGQSVSVRLSSYKALMESYTLNLEERDFSLEKSVAVDKSAGTRVYGDPSSKAIKSIAIPKSYGSFDGVSSLEVDGNAVQAKDASYLDFDSDSNALSLDSRLFESSVYGLKPVSVVLESSEYLARFDFEILFITKTITSFSEFGSYVSMAFNNDTIQGYFVLGEDLDAEGAYSPGSWTTSGWDYSSGFRATLDGRGHAIKNMKCGQYGLSGIIGSGAVVQNIDFTNLTYASSDSAGAKYALFARGMKNATFRHVNITLSQDSITNLGEAGKGKSLGLFTVETIESCRFEYVKVDASGFDLLSLGGKQGSNAVFSDCEVKCKSLQYVYSDVDISQVSGIALTIA